MWMPTGLMVMFLASLTVDANLMSPGCCVYDQTIWESSKDLWDVEKLSRGILDSNPYCPGRFEVRLGCYYSVSYDSVKEMFSITTTNTNDSFSGDWGCQSDGFDRANCTEKPQPFGNVPSANTIFRRIRGDHMQLFASAPHSNFSSYCPWYAGNEEKPICRFDAQFKYDMNRRDVSICYYTNFRYVRLCAEEPPMEEKPNNRSKGITLGLGDIIGIAVAVGVSLLICICCLCRRRISALLTRSPPTAAQTFQLSPPAAQTA